MQEQTGLKVYHTSSKEEYFLSVRKLGRSITGSLKNNDQPIL